MKTNGGLRLLGIEWRRTLKRYRRRAFWSLAYKLAISEIHNHQLVDSVAFWSREFRAQERQIQELQRESERLRNLETAARDLSLWTASIHWDGSPNTQEWLDELRSLIDQTQRLIPDLNGTEIDEAAP